MESAISLLKQLPETKEEIEKFSKIIISHVENGEVNDLLRYALRFKAIIALGDKLFDNIIFKDAILEEAERHGQKSFEYGNGKFQISEVGTTYKYEFCQDMVWEQLDAQIRTLTDRKKEREAFLKSISPEMTVFGEDGVQLLPPKKESKTQVKITLK